MQIIKSTKYVCANIYMYIYINMYQLSHGTSAIWTTFSVVKDFLWNCFPSLQTRKIKAENFWTRKICPYYTRNRAITCLSLRFHFLFGKVLTTSKAMKSHYSSEESEEYMTLLLCFRSWFWCWTEFSPL